MNTLPIDSTKPRQQRGAASVAIAMLIIFILVAAVLGVQSISGTSSVDAVKNDEQVTALFLAESGLERTTAIMTRAAAAGLNSNSCDDMPGGGPYSLGTGLSFTIDSATMYDSAGNPTTACAAAQCARCVVQVTGCVFQGTDCATAPKKAVRTLQQAIGMKVSNGTCGFGGKDDAPTSAPVRLSISNVSGSPALAFFNLAWRVNGNAGPQTPFISGNADAVCTGPGCLTWLIASSGGGSVSVGSMGAIDDVVPANSTSDTIVMPIDENRPYSAVGLLFPPIDNLTGPPTRVHPLLPSSYWHDSGGSKRTVTTSTSGLSTDGYTNSGVATTPSCDPPLADTFNTKQTCTSWCRGGDTLVFGLTGRSTALGDITTGVTFNSIPLKKVVHLPENANDCADYTPPDVYSEIHYLHNRDYISTTDASSGGTATGSIGVFFGSVINGSNVLTVSGPDFATSYLQVNDTIDCSGSGACRIPAGTTIQAFGSGNTSGIGKAGTYQMSNAATGTQTKAMKTTGTNRLARVLSVTSVGSGWLSDGDLITGSNIAANTRIAGTLGATSQATGDYSVNTDNETQDSIAITANGHTIHVGSGEIQTVVGGVLTDTPAAPVPGTLVAVRSGTGTLPALSCVATTPTPTSNVFHIGTWDGTQCTASLQTPTVQLVGATVCGGTCGLFNDPGSPTSETIFTVTTNNTGTTQWAGGFVCLKGVHPTQEPKVVTTSSARSSKWSEVVR